MKHPHYGQLDSEKHSKYETKVRQLSREVEFFIRCSVTHQSVIATKPPLIHGDTPTPNLDQMRLAQILKTA